MKNPATYVAAAHHHRGRLLHDNGARLLHAHLRLHLLLVDHPDLEAGEEEEEEETSLARRSERAASHEGHTSPLPRDGLLLLGELRLLLLDDALLLPPHGLLVDLPPRVGLLHWRRHHRRPRGRGAVDADLHAPARVLRARDLHHLAADVDLEGLARADALRDHDLVLLGHV